MKVLPICILASLVSGQSTKIDITPDFIYTVNHRDENQNSIKHRNAWTQFGQGVSEGLLKYTYTDQSTDCITQSRELWKGWSSLAIEWSSAQLKKGKTDD